MKTLLPLILFTFMLRPDLYSNDIIYVYTIADSKIDVCRQRGLIKMDDARQAAYRKGDGIKVGAMFYPYRQKVINGSIYTSASGELRGGDSDIDERSVEYEICVPTGKTLRFGAGQ